MSRGDREARASARRQVAVLRRTGLQALEQDPSPVGGAEAVSLVARLTETSWSLGGLEKPAYSRRETPCRFVPFPAR